MQIGSRAFEVAIQRIDPLVELGRRRIGQRVNAGGGILGRERFAELCFAVSELKEAKTAIRRADHHQAERSAGRGEGYVNSLPTRAVFHGRHAKLRSGLLVKAAE